MKRSLICVLLVFVLAIGVIVPASAAGLEHFEKVNTYTNGQFSDVFPSDWYYDSVKCAYELGLVKGSSETTFDPQGNITVMETIALACRLHAIYTKGTGDFMQGTPWYEVYLEYAQKNLKMGLPRNFDYMTVATREVFASILASALPKDALKKINHIEAKDLPDGFDISDMYRDAVLRLYRAGIVTGSDESGTFQPQSTIRRCEVAAIVTRMADTSLRKVFVPDKYPEKILLPSEEIFISGEVTVYVEITGDLADEIVCEYYSDMVEISFGDWEARTGIMPVIIKPLQNGTTSLRFHLTVEPEEFVYLDVNISGLE
ncbi:MAG: S-layer homology domain-containing protein [Oscillospiraceae bacterium]|nr:S-layer homology domain-containing protein [Oscillospiraceae bacterium]